MTTTLAVYWLGEAFLAMCDYQDIGSEIMI